MSCSKSEKKINFKKIYSILILFFTVILLSPPLSTENKVVIKYAIMAPRGTIWANSAYQIKKQIASATNGTVKIKIYYGGSMGTETEMLRRLMKTGSIDMASFTGIALGQVLPSIRILELPLFFKNKTQVDRVRKGLTKYFNDAFAKKGLKFVGWGEVGWVYLFTTKKITSMKDFQGLKAWSPAGDVLVQSMLKEMGIAAHPYPIPSVYPKLQSGGLDAILSSIAGLVGLQWNNYVNYVVKVRLANGTGGTLMSNSAWERIPEKYKNTVKSIIYKNSESLIQRVRIENKSQISTLKASGIQGIVMTPKQKQFLTNKANIIKRKMTGRLFSAALLSRAQSLK